MNNGQLRTGSGACWAALGMLGLAGCGGGGDSASAPPPPPPPPPTPSVLQGVFKDANVAGVDFESGGETGTTGADGRYTCETGASVSFAVGAVQLGSMDCATLASPPALVASGEFDDPEAVNIARFLQLLDSDGDPDNGIGISEGLQQVAGSWPEIDFGAADLDAQLAPVFADIQSVDQRTVTASPDAATAFGHMDEVLACAYGGTFIGGLEGTNEGYVAFVLARDLVGFAPQEFSFFAWDPVEEFILTSGGEFEFSVRPRLDSSSSGSAVLVDARFENPDRLSGSWNFPPESASGTLEAFRIDADDAELRFVGQFFASEARGVVTIGGNEPGVFSGIAYDVISNTQFDISGELDGQSTFELDVSGNGETFTAQTGLFFDTSGVIRMEGTWDDGSASGGQFSAVGCELN